MTYDITRAIHTDLDAIMKIEESCFAPGIRESRESFADRISTFPEGFLVLQPGSAGYLSSELWDKEPPAKKERWALNHSANDHHVADGSILYISSLAVLPSARGGAGRFLFNASIARIRESCPTIRRVVFVVNETWLAARHIYETEGFSYTGSIPDFFTASLTAENSTTALIMGKDL